MKSKIFFLLVFLSLFGLKSFAQICGFKLEGAAKIAYSNRVAAIASSTAQPQSTLTSNVTQLPVYVWIIRNSDGTTPEPIPAESIQKAIQEANSGFNFPLPNNPKFVLCGIKYVNDPAFTISKIDALGRRFPHDNQLATTYKKSNAINCYIMR
jgi:hypothetical protein